MSTQPNTTDLDRQRAEFEATFNLDEFRKMRRVLDGEKYQHDGTQSAWEGWQAATQQAAREQQEPVTYLRWWARQIDEGHGNIGHEEGFEECKPGELSDDGSPAFPVYAAPVAQQSEAGACTTCDGSGSVHRADGEYMGECPCGGEAGAPTAAAKQMPPPNAAMLRWALRELLSTLPERRDWFNPDAEEVLRDILKTLADEYASGRESAAPGAKQDAPERLTKQECWEALRWLDVTRLYAFVEPEGEALAAKLERLSKEAQHG